MQELSERRALFVREIDDVLDVARGALATETMASSSVKDALSATASAILDGTRSDPIKLTPAERFELESRARSRAGRADDARIARVLLLLAEGAIYQRVAQRFDCSAPFISKWKKRFLADGLAGLYARHKGRVATVLTPKMDARILNWTHEKPTDGSTHWSTRRLARSWASTT